MAALNVLVVGDGPWKTNNPQGQGINFAATQDVTDATFSVSEFIFLLRSSSAPAILVDTAHRRLDPGATFQNFVFTPAALAKYDVLWLFGYEGWNYQAAAVGGAITDAEVQAITAFMDSGGGVFATGDHAGMGSFMCGVVPRVRSMRKWFGRAQDQPAGYPATLKNYAGTAVTSVNWPGVSNDPNPGVGRADTLVQNPSDTATTFQFDDQSDAIPQQLSFPGGIVHPILRGANGALGRFPDHMHEGEVATPSDLTASLTIGGHPYTEYPTVSGTQPAPAVIATGNIVAGHSTMVDGSSCEQMNFSPDNTPTVANTIGTLCAYDGHAAGVGRIVTDSSFHHYLDLNLVGDPCGSSADRMAGFGLALQAPASGSVLAEMQAFYANTVIWLARPNRNFYFAVDKSSFGFDEASDNSSFPPFPNAFWLVIDGHSLSEVEVAVNGTGLVLSGPFNSIHATLAPGTPVTASDSRVLIPFSVTFSAAAMAAFPAANAAPVELLLAASINLGSASYTAETNFQLVAGADPFFVNVNPQTHNEPWLSQDLCVFTVNAKHDTSIPGIPVTLSSSQPTAQDPAAAQAFITGVLAHMNGSTQFTDVGNNDPFTNFPARTSSGDSSVTPTSNGSTNYNFAIARVRLSGPSGTSASPVKVFFRLFLTQTADTDFQPDTTYASTLDGSGLPSAPLAAPGGQSTPFFASGSSAGDYGPAGTNVHTITVDSTGNTSIYFGCFLDVYSGAFNWKSMGSHHCLVAQIAYDGDPIINANGITQTPGTCNQLAQRNLQITSSGNPGGAAAHRIPQTFNSRPSAALSLTRGGLLDYPDELLIDWGATPVGSVASIYWPQAAALDVVRLASQLYGSDELIIKDPHTVQCQAKRGLTCVPIPTGSAQQFPGLFTVDLPQGVRKGQEFNIIVRRLSSRQHANVIFVAGAARARRQLTGAALGRGGPQAVPGTPPSNVQRNWRYVIGTFQVQIPVVLEEDLLAAEESTYAIMLWRFNQLSPADAWHPVLQRYLQYLAGRVQGFGGDPEGIVPSPWGVPQGGPGGGGSLPWQPPLGREFTGKIEGLVYDRFGDFEGFLLLTEHGREHAFRSREAEVEERVRYAWAERVVISVWVEKHEPELPVALILRRRPH